LNPKGGCMKKLLAVLMVLSIASVASAGLTIVGEPMDPLMQSDEVVISIAGVAPQPANVDAWFILEGPGTNSGGMMTYPGDVAFMVQYVTDDEGILSWLGGLGYNTTNAYYLSFGDSQARPLDTFPNVVDGIVFHCDGPGDVTLKLVNIFDDGSGAVITPYDEVVIHQIPEPMTLGLLGLGGLFLRRRK